MDPVLLPPVGEGCVDRDGPTPVGGRGGRVPLGPTHLAHPHQALGQTGGMIELLRVVPDQPLVDRERPLAQDPRLVCSPQCHQGAGGIVGGIGKGGQPSWCGGVLRDLLLADRQLLAEGLHRLGWPAHPSEQEADAVVPPCQAATDVWDGGLVVG